MGCIVLVRCVLVLRCGLAGVVWYPDTVFRCGLAGVVWYPDAGWSTSASVCILHHRQPNHNVTPTYIEPEQYNP